VSLPVVVLVEDDAVIGENLSRAFEEVFEVRWVETGLAGFMAAKEADLVVLDLGLPDIDGLELCRRLCETWPKLPVMILTARQDEVEIVGGLEAGAVDYVTKPFRLGELIARINAHLRAMAPADPAALGFGDVAIDLNARRVAVDGVEVQLRPKELDLLVALAERIGAVITRDELMRRVWDENWFGSTKTLDVHMANLRRKLAPNGSPACVITTLRGVGFRLERP
jgi:DNA-binding response OmpR family regulator